jgi:hypothetical protein
LPSKSVLVARAALIASVLWLGGCGSSSTKSSAAAPTQVCPPGQIACVSQNPAIKATGPTDLATNLVTLMKRSNPTLKGVRLTCAAGQNHFPRVCGLAGTVETKRRLVRVAGQVSVFGIDTKTHTYAYAITYRPVTS